MADQTKEFLWVEKYRPTKVVECILPDRIKNIFQAYVDQKQIPNLLLHGSAGTGKTTVALAALEEIGMNYMFINGSKDNGIGNVRGRIEQFASTYAFNKKPKVIVIDEADYFTQDAQAALRGSIEEFSSNCTFIFTCNYPSKIMDAIHSRCVSIDFKLKKDEKPAMAAAFMKRMISILDQEKIKFSKKALAIVIERFFPDYRHTLGELQRIATVNGLNDEIVNSLLDQDQIQELVNALKDKDFKEMRKWVVINLDKFDDARFYRKVYDSLYTYMRPESIPQAILILAKYQYQAAFSVDMEINTVACLTEIMVDCNFL